MRTLGVLPLGRVGLALVPLCCIAFMSVSAVFAQERPLILEEVTVIDGAGNPPRERVSILIQDGHITSVGAKGSLPHPPGVETKHLPGRFVMPGLIDMHAHVTVIIFGDADGRPSSRQRYDRNVSEQVLRTLLAFGITTVRNAAAPSAEGVKLRDDVASGRIPGPRIFTAGEALDHFRGRQGPFVYVGSGLDVRREIERQARQRVDFIKLYAKLPARLAAAAIQTAHAHGLKVIGHLGETSWKEAANLGIDGICHGASWDSATLPREKRSAYGKSSKPYLKKRLDWIDWLDLDGPEISEMISALVQHRVVVDTTLIAYETKFRGNDPLYVESPDLTFVPEPVLNMWRRGDSPTSDWTSEDHERARALWPRVLALIKLYSDRGVRLVAGTDIPNPWVIPGASLHRELELLASAGIPPQVVIQMATKNAAEALGILGEAGTVEVGKLADLVVLTSNPLDQIGNTRKIEFVVQRGKILESQPTMNRP
jgi:imidazolonepropionase-like amidohydrolase